MSLTPTYCVVLPLASVETMSFGKPIGRARIAAVPIAVPPPPPSETTGNLFFGDELRENDWRALRHRRDGFTAIAFGLSNVA